MKNGINKYFFVLALIASILTFSSCKESINPGDVSIETRNTADFTGIDIGYGFVAEITYSADTYEVIVEAPENFQKYIYTRVVDGIMKLRVDNDVKLNNFTHRKIYIKTPLLETLVASGGSHCNSADKFSSSKFTSALSGGSQATVSIDCDDFISILSGGSILSINEGNTESLTITSSGGSQFYGFDLDSKTCNIISSGGCDLEVNVSDNLNVTASGGSKIYYIGNPAITQNVSDGSELINYN
nr:head GIN domain-containing protein [uncultured Carboxylicivirga sp.]